MAGIERQVEESGQGLEPVDASQAIMVKATEPHGYLSLVEVPFKIYPQRSILGTTLMTSQSFLYNSIFFTYVLVLLGHLFDTVGRRKMIAGTYFPGTRRRPRRRGHPRKGA